ncbi:MAG: hypothetical protein AAFQ58_24160, partial [Pseudomonadota bacterium]
LFSIDPATGVLTFVAAPDFEAAGDADGDNFGPMMATACIIVTPLIVAFLLAQRRFIEGITLSGMK